MTKSAVERLHPYVPSTARATRARRATPWAPHRTEIAAVVAGTALVAAQAARLGSWITDEAAVSFDSSSGLARTGPCWAALLALGRWLGLFGHGSWFGVPDLVWFPKLLALFCVVGILTAVASTARALTGRRGWPVVLLAAGALAVPLPVVRWLFSGLASPLHALALALFTRTLVRGIVGGRLLSPRTAVAAGLLAALAAGSRTGTGADTAGLALVFPALALFRPGAGLAALTRAASAYALAFALPAGAALLWWHPPASDPTTTPLPALLVAAVLGLALARAGRLRRGVGALLRQAESPYGRRALIAAVVCAFSLSLTAHSAPPPPDRPGLCFTAARYGGMFVAYAHRLGLERSTVALPDPAGALLTASPSDGQQFLELAAGSSTTDPEVAAAWAAHDMARLRRHVLDRVRPEFVHVDGAFARDTGLTPRLLADHGYRPLLREDRGRGGDFVHRSALTAPDRLPDLRRWARTTVARLRTDAAHPRCTLPETRQRAQTGLVGKPPSGNFPRASRNAASRT